LLSVKYSIDVFEYYPFLQWSRNAIRTKQFKDKNFEFEGNSKSNIPNKTFQSLTKFYCRKRQFILPTEISKVRMSPCHLVKMLRFSIPFAGVLPHLDWFDRKPILYWAELDKMDLGLAQLRLNAVSTKDSI